MGIHVSNSEACFISHHARGLETATFRGNVNEDVEFFHSSNPVHR
jgi:hypothetical protein